MAFAARGIALLLLLVSVAVIIAATTMPWSMYYVGHSHWAHVEWVPFSRTVRPDDFLLNILLFVPFGYSASAFVGRDRFGRDRSPSGPSPRPRHTPEGASAEMDAPETEAAEMDASERRPYLIVGAAIVLSTGVELFQVYCHGRLPTTTDIISNALGAYLGARLAAARVIVR